MRISKKTLAALVIVAALAAGAVAAGLMLRREMNLEDVDVVTNRVSKHYLLPDETPALATVEDQNKLSSEFLRSAEDGDKLLVFKNAKKVILYRPSIDKIIEVGPVSIAPTQGLLGE